MDAVFRDASRQTDNVSEVLDGDMSPHYECEIWIGIGLTNDAFLTIKVGFPLFCSPAEALHVRVMLDLDRHNYRETFTLSCPLLTLPVSAVCILTQLA